LNEIGCLLDVSAPIAKRQPIPFGKYLLLDRVNIGGMAEVWRAKTFGAGGFERLVAIKRILPNIAEDEDFITMFIDEAKITVQLNHSNIAKIEELAHLMNSYFIAMEYVSGKDVRAIFDRCRKNGEPAPIAMACFILAQSAEGLDYAHRAKDNQGRDMGIVHRDVSPQNLLVSYDGEVKVIDFGIAKAANKATRTQAGILKGKFGYMSPEQIRGLPLDGRSDIFALGVCLFEVLTGERLFVGDSDFSVLEKVRKVEMLPPSYFNKKIPDALEKIVLKALAKDVTDRYQYASQLAEDLRAFMYGNGFGYTRQELAAFMKVAFAEEYQKETSRIAEYNDIKAPAAMQAAAQLPPIASLPPPRAPLAPPVGKEPAHLADAPQFPTQESAGALTGSRSLLDGNDPDGGEDSNMSFEDIAGMSIPTAPPVPVSSPSVSRSQPPPPVNEWDSDEATVFDIPTLGKRPPASSPSSPPMLYPTPVPARPPAPPKLSSPSAPPARPSLSAVPVRKPTQGQIRATVPPPIAPPVESNPTPVPAPLDANDSSAELEPVHTQGLEGESSSNLGANSDEPENTDVAAAAPSSSKGLIVALLAVIFALVAGGAWMFLVKPEAKGLLIIDAPEELAGKMTLNINGKNVTEEDGALIRQWPHLEALKAGKITVRLSAPGYETLLETVEVIPGDEPTSLSKTLKKKPVP
jgi:eukaryotic-like serine/threonine-protein kinase